MAEHVVLPGMRHWWHSRFGAGSGPRRTGPAALTTGSPTSSRRCRRCARMGTRDRWTAILASSPRVRRLAIAHPVLTLAAIVLTAHHYWLDTIVAAFLFVAALLFDRWRIKSAQREEYERHR